MASVLEDFIVRLGFKVNGDQLAKFKHSVSNLNKTVAGIGGALSAALIKVSYDAKELVTTVSRTNTSITGMKSLEQSFERVGGSADQARQVVNKLAQDLKKNPEAWKAYEEAFPGVKFFDEKTGKLRDLSKVVVDIAASAQKMTEQEARAKFETFGLAGASDTLLDKNLPKYFDDAYKANYKLGEGLEKNADKLKKFNDNFERAKNAMTISLQSLMGELADATDADKAAGKVADYTERELPRQVKGVGNFVRNWAKPEGDYRIKLREAVNAVFKNEDDTRQKAKWGDDQIKLMAELWGKPVEDVRKEVEEAKKKVAEWDRINEIRAEKAYGAQKQANTFLETIAKNTDPKLLSNDVLGGLAAGAPGVTLDALKPKPKATGGSNDEALFQRQMKAYDFFVNKKKYTPEQAAGMIGVLTAESKLDPTAQRKGGTDTGIGQWIATRQPEFWKTHASIFGAEKSASYGGDIKKVPLEEQLEVWEAERPVATAILKQQRTSQGAVDIALRGIENGHKRGLATPEQIDRAYAPFGNSYQAQFITRYSEAVNFQRRLESSMKNPGAHENAVRENAVKGEKAPKQVSDAGNSVTINNIFNGATDPDKVQDAVEDGIKTAYDRIGARYSVNASFG